MADIVDIAGETRKYRDEWLLLDVAEVDELDRPAKGLPLCHSESRDEIHRGIMQRRECDLQTIFAGDPVPVGVVPVISPLEVVEDIGSSTLD